jgi:hypothetical protein
MRMAVTDADNMKLGNQRLVLESNLCVFVVKSIVFFR